MRRHIGLLCALFIGVATVVPGAPPSGSRAEQKIRDIKRFLALSGAAGMGEQVLDGMIAAQSKAMPQVPSAFWVQLRKNLSGAEMVDLVVPVYDKYLTQDEVHAIVVFFESPAGRKLAEVQPQIVAESMAIGQEWGRKVAARIMRDLQEKGYR